MIENLILSAILSDFIFSFFPNMSSKSIVEVPSEVITEILKYCVGQDVLNFSEAFNNFDKILSAIMDNRLWKNAVIGPKDLKKYMKYLGSHTKSLTIVGSGTKSQKNNKGKQSSSSSALTESLISSICLRQGFKNVLS